MAKNSSKSQQLDVLPVPDKTLLFTLEKVRDKGDLKYMAVTFEVVNGQAKLVKKDGPYYLIEAKAKVDGAIGRYTSELIYDKYYKV